MKSLVLQPVASTMSIADFCRSFVNKFSLRNAKKAEKLALALRSYCGIHDTLSFEDIRKVMIDNLGVTEILLRDDIGNAQGVHGICGDRSYVLVRKLDTEIGLGFTLAHELREMLGAELKKQHPRFKDFSGYDLERQADLFASVFIMGRKAFLERLVDSGFDLIWLASYWEFSLRYGILRAIREMNWTGNAPPLWVTILRRDPDLPEGFFRTDGSFRSPKFDRRTRGSVPNFFFPKRGQMVPVTGVLREALDSARPVYVDKVIGVEYWNESAFSVVVRPMVTNSQVNKLFIMAMPRTCSRRLDKQVLSIRPIRYEEQFQFFPLAK